MEKTVKYVEEYTTNIEEMDLRELAKTLANQIRQARLNIETMEPALEQVKKRLKKYEI